jgi:S-adenosylmethionine:diacylglycerol 3-amino-3-carboxypropyl transferase
LRAFLDLDEPVEQARFWQSELNNWRFRTALDALFSVTALRSFYAPDFLDFLPKRLGAVMRGRMERCFYRHPNRSNPYARSLLSGELSSQPPPVQARDIQLVHADAAAFLEQSPAGSFNAFTLSNILDGADTAYRHRLFAAVQHAAAPGAVVVIRSFSNAEERSPANQAEDDRSMLWGSVLVGPAPAFVSNPSRDLARALRAEVV